MTGRGAREFTWMEDRVRSSLGFGHWHTHGASLAEELTRPDAGRVRLVALSGRGDRETGPEDLVGA